MPRLTRAQLRAQEAERGPQNIHEDVEAVTAAATQGYDAFVTKDTDRAPLGEIYNDNNMSQPVAEQTERQGSAEQIKEAKNATCTAENDLTINSESNENFLPYTKQEVRHGENWTRASSVAEVVAADLRQKDPTPVSFQLSADIERPETPQNLAAQVDAGFSATISGQRSIAAEMPERKTPVFDPSLHVKITSSSQSEEHKSQGEEQMSQGEEQMSQGEEHKSEDSFVESIKTRRPSQAMAPVHPATNGGRSPAEETIGSKHNTRIEDSVEAMDALEEAIERVAGELPRVNENTPLAIKEKETLSNASSGSAASAGLDRSASKSLLSAKNSPTTNTTTLATVKAAPRNTAPRVPSDPLRRRPSTLTHVKSRTLGKLDASAAVDKGTRRAPSTAPPNKGKTRIRLSTSKPGFVPAKSAKPLTKSSFTLPGDAFAAKLKAQREERLKREEAEVEAARKRTEFKARPVPKSVAAGLGKARVSSVLPRETATSRARLSLMAAKKDVGGKDNVAPSEIQHVTSPNLGSGRARSIAGKTAVPATNHSHLSVMKTRNGLPAATTAKKSTVPANSLSVRRNTTMDPAPMESRRSSTLRPTAVSGVTSSSIGSSTIKAATETAATATGTFKGKEVFNRGKIAEQKLQEQQEEKKKAAMKARADAAERGRLASREWAKKKKRETLTMTMTTTTTTETKVGAS